MALKWRKLAIDFDIPTTLTAILRSNYKIISDYEADVVPKQLAAILIKQNF